MKNTVLRTLALAGVIVLLNACKETDISPKMADTVVGTYRMNFIKVGADETGLPVGSISGTIVVTKIDDGRVKMTSTLKDSRDGSSEAIFDGDEVTLTSSGKRIDFSVDGARAGHYEDDAIEILGTSQSNGSVIIVRGKR